MELRVRLGQAEMPRERVAMQCNAHVLQRQHRGTRQQDARVRYSGEARRELRVFLTCACLQDRDNIVESAGYRVWVTSGAQVELEVVQLGVGGHIEPRFSPSNVAQRHNVIRQCRRRRLCLFRG